MWSKFVFKSSLLLIMSFEPRHWFKTQAGLENIEKILYQFMIVHMHSMWGWLSCHEHMESVGINITPQQLGCKPEWQFWQAVNSNSKECPSLCAFHKSDILEIFALTNVISIIFVSQSLLWHTNVPSHSLRPTLTSDAKQCYGGQTPLIPDSLNMTQLILLMPMFGGGGLCYIRKGFGHSHTGLLWYSAWSDIQLSEQINDK